MRRGRTKRKPAERGPHCTRQLEELVRTVAALDGARAGELLSGLPSRVRPRALGLLRWVEKGNRAERHARLASVLGRQSPASADLEGVPGRLGTLLRAQPGGLRGDDRTTDGVSLIRWARRLLAELDGAMSPR